MSHAYKNWFSIATYKLISYSFAYSIFNILMRNSHLIQYFISNDIIFELEYCQEEYIFRLLCTNNNMFEVGTRSGSVNTFIWFYFNEYWLENKLWDQLEVLKNHNWGLLFAATNKPYENIKNGTLCITNIFRSYSLLSVICISGHLYAKISISGNYLHMNLSNFIAGGKVLSVNLRDYFLNCFLVFSFINVNSNCFQKWTD